VKRPRAYRSLVATSAFALIAAAACGGSDSGGGTKGGNNTEPAAVAISGGDNQIGAVGSPLATPLAARVTNSQGNAVSGKTVTFTVTRGMGTVASSTVTTDNNGVAQTTWTLGPGAVRQEAQASIGSFVQTATATVDTTRALFLLAIKDTVSVGDTIWINAISGTTGLSGETRGVVQETFTTSIPAAALMRSIIYTQGEHLEYSVPAGGALNFITSGPLNQARRQLYLRVGYVAQQIGSGKNVQFAHTATSFFAARSFNNLLDRVSVVGTPVHIR
jgi:hypothetical protein